MTLPRFIKPMLAQAVPRPFDSDRYRFEVKWDGIRCLAFIEEGRIRLQSRQLLDMTGQFPELAALGALPTGTVLDGELIIFADNRPCLSNLIMMLQESDGSRRGYSPIFGQYPRNRN